MVVFPYKAGQTQSHCFSYFFYCLSYDLELLFTNAFVLLSANQISVHSMLCLEPLCFFYFLRDLPNLFL